MSVKYVMRQSGLFISSLNTGWGGGVGGSSAGLYVCGIRLRTLTAGVAEDIVEGGRGCGGGGGVGDGNYGNSYG